MTLPDDVRNALAFFEADLSPDDPSQGNGVVLARFIRAQAAKTCETCLYEEPKTSETFEWCIHLKKPCGCMGDGCNAWTPKERKG